MKALLGGQLPGEADLTTGLCQREKTAVSGHREERVLPLFPHSLQETLPFPSHFTPYFLLKPDTKEEA